MACLLWIYWVGPEKEDNEYDHDSDMEDSHGIDSQSPEGTVWVSACGDQVPDEALPVTGVLHCPGIQGGQLHLDGSSVGPYMLHPETGTQNGHCILSGLLVRPVPPDGYTYFAKEPSPLMERCEELGGCELQ